MLQDTIPISPTTRGILIELADQTGRPVAELREAAVETFRRSLTAVFPVSSIPGVNPTDVWEGSGQADAGRLTAHADLFAKLRRRQ
jgi:hypothetical protein